MKIIQELTENIMEEVSDACKYAKLAVHYKESDHDTAEVYYILSKEEITHMNKLHARTIDLISTYRREHGEPPVEMMAVYNYLHDKYMAHAAEVRHFQALYTG